MTRQQGFGPVFCTSIASLPLKQRSEPGWTQCKYLSSFFSTIAHRCLSGARTGLVDIWVFRHAVHTHNSFCSHQRRHSVHIYTGNSYTSIRQPVHIDRCLRSDPIISLTSKFVPSVSFFFVPPWGRDKKEEKLDFSSFSAVGGDHGTWNRSRWTRSDSKTRFPARRLRPGDQ